MPRDSLRSPGATAIVRDAIPAPVKGTLRRGSALRPLTAARFAPGQSRRAVRGASPWAALLASGGRSRERERLEVVVLGCLELVVLELVQRP